MQLLSKHHRFLISFVEEKRTEEEKSACASKVISILCVNRSENFLFCFSFRRFQSKKYSFPLSAMLMDKMWMKKACNELKSKSSKWKKKKKWKVWIINESLSQSSWNEIISKEKWKLAYILWVRIVPRKSLINLLFLHIFLFLFASKTPLFNGFVTQIFRFGNENVMQKPNKVKQAFFCEKIMYFVRLKIDFWPSKNDIKSRKEGEVNTNESEKGNIERIKIKIKVDVIDLVLMCLKALLSLAFFAYFIFSSSFDSNRFPIR